VTGLISTSGRQFNDWSADYRFFSKDRVDPSGLFDVIRRQVVELLDPKEPLVVAMDDTISRKQGRLIVNTGFILDRNTGFDLTLTPGCLGLLS